MLKQRSNIIFLFVDRMIARRREYLRNTFLLEFSSSIWLFRLLLETLFLRLAARMARVTILSRHRLHVFRNYVRSMADHGCSYTRSLAICYSLRSLSTSLSLCLSRFAKFRADTMTKQDRITALQI